MSTERKSLGDEIPCARPDPLLPFRMPWRGLWVCVKAVFIHYCLRLVLPFVVLVWLLAGTSFDGADEFIAIGAFILIFGGAVLLLFALRGTVAYLQRHYCPDLSQTWALGLALESKVLAFGLSAGIIYLLPPGMTLILRNFAGAGIDFAASVCLADALVFGLRAAFVLSGRLSWTWLTAGVLWLLSATAIAYGGWAYLLLVVSHDAADTVGIFGALGLLWLANCLWVALPWLLLEARHPEAETELESNG